MGLLEESLKAKGGPRSSNATILVTEWKAPGIFLTKKNNRQRDQFFQFLFVKSYCKFHLCPSPSSSSSSVSRCQPCFYPWTVNRNAFVIRYFFTVLRHVFLCLSLLRFPSGTQPFFPFRFVNSLVISSSIFGRVIFSDTLPTLSSVVRGPAGRYVWTMQLRQFSREKNVQLFT